MLIILFLFIEENVDTRRREMGRRTLEEIASGIGRAIA